LGCSLAAIWENTGDGTRPYKLQRIRGKTPGHWRNPRFPPGFLQDQRGLRFFV
jgi:hypothetical protein